MLNKFSTQFQNTSMSVVGFKQLKSLPEDGETAISECLESPKLEAWRDYGERQMEKNSLVVKSLVDRC